MAKIKTKSSAKKRFKITGTGKVRFASACLAHNTAKRPQKMKRQNRGLQTMASCNARVARRNFLRNRG